MSLKYTCTFILRLRQANQHCNTEVCFIISSIHMKLFQELHLYIKIKLSMKDPICHIHHDCSFILVSLVEARLASLLYMYHTQGNHFLLLLRKLRQANQHCHKHDTYSSVFGVEYTCNNYRIVHSHF